MIQNLLVDASMIHKKNGMNVALRNVLHGLVAQEQVQKITIVTTQEGKEALDIQSPSVTIWTVPNIFQPIIEQCILPIIALFTRSQCLLCPYNTFPIMPMLAKRIVVLHDLIFLDAHKKTDSFMHMLANAYRTFVVRHFISHVNKIITDSDYSKKEIVRILAYPLEDIFVVPLAIDEKLKQYIDLDKIEKINELDLKTTRYFFHLSAADERKNTLLVIEAFQRFLEQNASYVLILASALPAAALEKINNIPNIFFVGKVSVEELAALYKHARIFLFPSSYEGFGLPILESFYARCPVITSKNSSLPEVGQDAAYYIDDFSVSSLLEIITYVDTQLEDREEHIRKGEIIAEQYSWQKTVVSYIDIIQSALYE